MDKKSNLTNEKVSAKFKSQFDLVGYAIELVNNMVKSGRAPRVKMEVQNPAVVALEEIVQGKDILDDLPEMDVQEVVTYVFQSKEPEPETIKSPEKKKRRLL